MKGCFTTLLLALVVAFIAAFFGRSCHRERIEETLTQRVAPELKKAYPNVDVKYDHLTAIVSGQATASEIEGIKAKVKELAQGNGRVHVVVTDGGTAPAPVEQTPSRFTIFRDNEKLTLNGEVNSAQSKALLGKELAQIEGVNVDNQLQVGTNTAEFPSFGHAIKAVPAVMAAANNGRIEASPTEVKVSGLVASEKVKSDLLAMFKPADWDGAKIIDNITVKPPAEIIPPPIERTIPADFSYSKSGNTITLTGNVDSEATKLALGQAAQGDGITVDNQLKVSDQVIKFPFMDVAKTGLPALLGATTDGVTSFKDGKITLKGLVKDSDTKQGILAAFAPTKWGDAQLIDQVEIAPPPRTKPINLVLVKEASKITLDGVVDRGRTKNLIGNSAKLAGLNIENKIKVSDEVKGLSETNPLSAGIKALVADTENGRVEASPDRLLVAGLVKDKATKDAILGHFTGSGGWKANQIVDQLKIKPAMVEMTPIAYTVTKDGENISLVGDVDSAETKSMLGNVTNLDGMTIDNKIKVGENIAALPSAKPASLGIPALLEATEKGKVVVAPDKVVVEGLVKDQATKNSILAHFKSEGGWSADQIVDRLKIKPVMVKLAPIAYTVTKKADNISLVGTVDSAETKSILGDVANLDGMTIDNKIKVGEKVEALPSAKPTSLGIPALLQATENGKVVVAPDKVIVEGLVKDQSTKNKILSHFKSEGGWSADQIVDRIKIKPAMVEMKPINFTLTKKGKNLQLAGQVDSAEVKTAIENVAKIEGMKVKSNLKVGDNIEGLPSLAPATKGIPELFAETTNGKVSVNDKSVVVSGLVKDLETKKRIMSAFSAAPWDKMRIVDEVRVKPKMVSPNLTWTQETPKKVILEGLIPNEKARENLVSAARKRIGNDGEVIDKLKIGNNVENSPWLTSLPEFVNKSLPKVDEQVIKISDTASSISGVVPSGEVMSDVSVAFSGMNPPGKMDVSLKVKEMTPPPPPEPTVIPEVRITGIGNDLEVSGNVPNAIRKKSVVDMVTGIHGVAKVNPNKLKVGNDVKDEKYLEPLPGFISNYYGGTINEREIWLKNKKLTLKGVAPSEKVKADALAMANPIKNNGVQIIDRIRVVKPKVMVPNVNPPPGPQPPVDTDKADQFSVYFGTGETHIQKKETPTAQRILAKAKQTSGKIVIDGFADERGTSDLNEYLSDERAKRIRTFLIDNGIDANRIVSVVGRGAVAGTDGYQEYRRTDVKIMAE